MLGCYLWHAVKSMLTRVFSLFAIFFMQLWGNVSKANAEIISNVHRFSKKISMKIFFYGNFQFRLVTYSGMLIKGFHAMKPTTIYCGALN